MPEVDSPAGTLTGRVAFVTGGSGAIGQDICRALAREGARVAFSYLSNAEGAAKLADELGRPGETVLAVQLDVSDAEGVERVAREIEVSLGGVDVLVNNAAHAEAIPFVLLEMEDWDRMMDVNVKGLFLTTRVFLKGMIHRRRGSIVNIGSLGGTRVLEVPVHYATSKTAVLGFTRALAREVGRYGVRVNAVLPGLLHGGVGMKYPEKQWRDYAEHCTLSRLGEPAEVAELVAFLAGDRSSYINAQAIQVDGGI